MLLLFEFNENIDAILFTTALPCKLYSEKTSFFCAS